MRIFRCNFAKFSGGMAPDHPRVVVPSTFPSKLICDVTRLWRNFGPPPGNFLRTPLIRACFHKVVRVFFVLSVISSTFLGFHDYIAIHLHSLTWRSLLEDRTTFNLLSQLEPDERERKNALAKKQSPLLQHKKVLFRDCYPLSSNS